MSEIWTSLAVQIPIVVAFMLFMIHWQRSQHSANDRNHEVWQRWLDKVIQDARIERTEWRKWIRARDRILISAMARIENRVSQQTNVVLSLVLSSNGIQPEGDVDRITKAIEALREEIINEELPDEVKKYLREEIDDARIDG